MRIDKFIWCVRLYKTRSISSKSVDGGKVKLNDLFIKPGKNIQIGDTIAIKVTPIWKTYKVIAIPKSRVGAKLVDDLIAETTPESDLLELDNLQLINKNNLSLGIKGRPTKKNRRNIDKLNN